MKTAAAFLTCLMILTTCAFIAEADAEIVHIGLSGVDLYELPSDCQRQRFYDQEKLEVRKVTVGVGIQVVRCWRDSWIYSTVASTTAVASVQGLPIKTVMGWFDRQLHMLVAKSSTKSITELKGKRVAVSAIGSPPHILVRASFRKSGLNPDKRRDLSCRGRIQRPVGCVERRHSRRYSFRRCLSSANRAARVE